MRRILLALAVLPLAGCAPRQASPAHPPTSPAPVPITALPSQTTPPTPEAGAIPHKWTTAQVIRAFNADGLEAQKPFVMGHKDYGVGPMTADEGERFFIPSLGPDNGGHVFTFSSQGDLDTMKSYYVGLGKASGALFSYVYVRDNVLVQINGDLSDAKARKYQAALENMK